MAGREPWFVGPFAAVVGMVQALSGLAEFASLQVNPCGRELGVADSDLVGVGGADPHHLRRVARCQGQVPAQSLQPRQQPRAFGSGKLLGSGDGRCMSSGLKNSKGPVEITTPQKECALVCIENSWKLRSSQLLRKGELDGEPSAVCKPVKARLVIGTLPRHRHPDDGLTQQPGEFRIPTPGQLVACSSQGSLRLIRISPSHGSCGGDERLNRANVVSVRGTGDDAASGTEHNAWHCQ